MAAADGDGGVAPVAFLDNLIREKDEEVEHWRIRCLQAQVEARALQKEAAQANTAISAKESGGCGEQALGGAAPAGSSDGALDDEEVSPSAFALPMASAELRSREQVEMLRRELQHRAEMLTQLEADFARDRQSIQTRYFEAEAQSAVCREELIQMTQRAESLSEQVRRSRGVSGEAQAARAEVARLCAALAESEARLSAAAAASAAGAAAAAAAGAAAGGSSPSGAGAPPGEASGAAPTDAAPSSPMKRSRVPAGGRGRVRASPQQQRRRPGLGDFDEGPRDPNAEVLQELSAIMDLHAELERELRGGSTSSAVSGGGSGGGMSKSSASVPSLRLGASHGSRSARASGSAGGLGSGSAGGLGMGSGHGGGGKAGKPGRTSAAGERLLKQIAQQLERLQQVIAAGRGGPPAGSDGAGGEGGAEGLAVQQLHLEQLQPQPLQDLRINWEPDAILASRQRLSEARVAAEEARERAVLEHCDDMDELEQRHARERDELRAEIRELRSERARAEVDAAIARPVHELRSQLVWQMGMVRKEFASQLADIGRLERQLPAASTHAIEAVRERLEDCQAELQAWQSDVQTLRELLRREQRAHKQLRQCLHQHDAVFAPAPVASIASGVGPGAGATTVAAEEDPGSPDFRSASICLVEPSPEPTLNRPRSWAHQASDANGLSTEELGASAALFRSEGARGRINTESATALLANISSERRRLASVLGVGQLRAAAKSEP